jgi:hypothetical protein
LQRACKTAKLLLPITALRIGGGVSARAEITR